MQKVKTAVFPVGGLGTRFLPATKVIPKEMLTIVDKPLIQYAFEEARDSGIEKFIFITGRNKNVIANHFDNVYELQKVLEEKQKNEILALTKDWLPEKPGSIAFIRQREPLGLGHAVLCAKNFINEPFAVLLADELFLSPKPVLGQMIKEYEREQGNIILVKEEDKSKTKLYGVIEPKSERAGDIIKIKTMVEKPSPEVAPSNYCVTGRYILDPKIFDYLENQTAGSGGEIQLTDALNKMALAGHNSYGYIYEGKRYDCGSRRGFVEANVAFALNNPELRDDVIKLVREVIGGN